MLQLSCVTIKEFAVISAVNLIGVAVRPYHIMLKIFCNYAMLHCPQNWSIMLMVIYSYAQIMLKLCLKYTRLWQCSSHRHDTVTNDCCYVCTSCLYVVMYVHHVCMLLRMYIMSVCCYVCTSCLCVVTYVHHVRMLFCIYIMSVCCFVCTSCPYVVMYIMSVCCYVCTSCPYVVMYVHHRP